VMQGQHSRSARVRSRSGYEALSDSAMLVRRAIAGAHGLTFPDLNGLFQDVNDQLVE